MNRHGNHRAPGRQFVVSASEPAKLPSIKDLRLFLDYYHVGEERDNFFYRTLKRYPSSFTSSDNIPGAELLKWKDPIHQKGLFEMTIEVLDRDGKGPFFWPDDAMHSNYRQLRYSNPGDRQTIHENMRMLFFQINQQTRKKGMVERRVGSNPVRRAHTRRGKTGLGGGDDDEPIDVDAAASDEEGPGAIRDSIHVEAVTGGSHVATAAADCNEVDEEQQPQSVSIEADSNAGISMPTVQGQLDTSTVTQAGRDEDADHQALDTVRHESISFNDPREVGRGSPVDTITSSGGRVLRPRRTKQTKDQHGSTWNQSDQELCDLTADTDDESINDEGRGDEETSDRRSASQAESWQSTNQGPLPGHRDDNPIAGSHPGRSATAPYPQRRSVAFDDIERPEVIPVPVMKIPSPPGPAYTPVPQPNSAGTARPVLEHEPQLGFHHGVQKSVPVATFCCYFKCWQGLFNRMPLTRDEFLKISLQALVDMLQFDGVRSLTFILRTPIEKVGDKIALGDENQFGTMKEQFRYRMEECTRFHDVRRKLVMDLEILPERSHPCHEM